MSYLVYSSAYDGVGGYSTARIRRHAWEHGITGVVDIYIEAGNSTTRHVGYGRFMTMTACRNMQ